MQAKVTKSRRGKTPAKMLSKNQPADLDRESGLLIGARLKHARLNRRISLRQLADDVGCTESFLSKVENDKVRPSLTMLHTIVKSLGINIAKLFSEPDSAVVTVLK
ncbi:helix-turn-helix domain-containing protein, partial [Pseudomonas fluorescens]|uniref:helix-turn-helix domain-containing protein n=2 Tax=Pseudomonadota TaxID=1224 RepID=UPI001CA624CA|nr:helix-turn-helix domain-containing protein [Pseudomonas fluorescens]